MKYSLLFICFIFLLNGLLPSLENTSPKIHRIEIAQMQFRPAELSVKKGDMVVFTNKDIVTHDVTEESGKRWKSPTLATGKSWSITVTQSASYYCSFHPMMKGKVLIK